jgi:hypothetical protein
MLRSLSVWASLTATPTAHHAKEPKISIVFGPKRGSKGMGLVPFFWLGLFVLVRALAADRLVVTEGTVKTHVSRVLAKLQLRDRIHAVIYAYQNGIA